MGYKLTRIAPTPSGYLHLGNLLSFAITAALARRSGAEILLRIDDLDRDRAQREYVEDIFETLRFMEIPWDRGPRTVDEFSSSWSQVDRLPLYQEALSRLRAAGAVFGCSCSRAKVLRASRDGGYPGTCVTRGLELDEAEVSWRLKTEDEAADRPEVLRVKTFSSGIVEARLPAEMRDFVVRKKDGFPAYQLSSVVDDVYHGVDLIVRGQDLWTTTLAQLYLSYPLGAAGFAGAAGFREVRFYHHPLLTAGGEKLSKSAGSTSIQYLRRRGLSAADIYKIIAREVVGLLRAEDVRDWAGLAALVLDVDR